MKAEKLSSSCAVLRFIASFILLASLLFLPKAQAAVGDIFTIGELRYTVLTEEPATQTGTVFVQRGSTGISGDIEIPASVTNGGINYSVTLIPNSAFQSCSYLTGIIIPESVTGIGAEAFNGCESLTSVVIGGSVTEIGERAFYYCAGLKSITIPNSVTSIGAESFSYCGELTSVVIGSRVTDIGDGAFYGCYSMTSITIPDSVTSIGEGAFYYCSSLTEIVVGKNNPNFSSFEGVLFNKDYTILIGFPSGKAEIYTIPDGVISIGDGAFYGCSGLTSLTIPNSVTGIGEKAFASCLDLKKLVIGDGVASIGDGSFNNCTSMNEIVVGENNLYFSTLDGVLFDKNQTLLILSPRYTTGTGAYTIPNGVISIGAGAFSDCVWLRTITIPNSVTSIGDEAFSDCDGLTNITISNSVTHIGNWAFASCYGLTDITIPDSVTEIGAGAFAFCDSVTNVVIGDSVTSIGDEAFQSCSKLTSITIPDTVINIGYDAFYACEQLPPILFSTGVKILVRYSKNNTDAEYSIPGTVTRIGTQAFSDCDGLTNITIPNSVTHIGNWAFSFCSGLTSITLPGSITGLGEGTFFNCSKLTSIEIPGSVTSIGNSAFSYCNGMTDVYFKGDAPVLPEGNAFGAPSIIYYKPGTTGWTNPWDGRPTVLWISGPEITEQPQSQAVMEGDSVTFNVAAVGTEPLSYQWYKEGVAIEGAVEASYTIEHVSIGDLGSYTVIVSSEEGETTSPPAKLTMPQPHRATATVQVVDGVVVGLTLIDGGWGYTNAPHIIFIDETGTGANGHCIIEEGVVTQILIDNPGSNYSGEATVLIGSPSSYTGLEISVSIPKVEVKITMHLIQGMEYRLWSSVDCINWTQVGEPFIAEEEEKDMLFQVEGNGRFFKLQEN